MTPLRPGLRLHDRFTLVERIGLGGMAEVWRADDQVLERPVAVKVLASSLSRDRTLRAATWREAKAAARLAHPNVTQVYDYGEAPLPGGGVSPYLVMELVDGENLADRLRRAPMAWPEAVRTASEVAAALAAAHRLGVVHRDIKPGNVMLTAGGAKVLDFGIAALADGPEPDRGTVVGTPGYVAPEVLAGAPARPASDVYALGVVLYEALTRRPPSLVMSFAEAASAAPLPPPDVPPEVARLCEALMSFHPGDRPRAAEAASRLAAFARTAPTVDTPVSPSPPATLVAPPPTLFAAPPDRGGANRLLLAGLAGGIIAIGLALTIIAAALLSGSGEPSRLGGGPSTSPTTAAAPPSSPRPSPTGSTAVINALDNTVTAALGAGRIDAEAARKLRDRLDRLREEAAGDRPERDVRKQAGELAKDLDEQLKKGRIDRQTADELRALLRPLLA
ncbi:serine/threonine-protein kinase [Micromonospora sp. CPCC 206061]|uniref:serine/threonine-protein kinase n=1 Tax=Micromonospora sp. CPCC 206061 TaxID=3122410 RepID=UPI002FF40164